MAVEPNIDVLPQALADQENVQLTQLDNALEDAEIILLLVDHTEFKEVSSETLQGKYIIDTRGVWR